MPHPRNTTPDRSETQTIQRSIASRPSKQANLNLSSTAYRPSTFITITMKQYNLLRGGLRELINITPECRKGILQPILNHMDPLENVQTFNFDEATMIPRIISMSEIRALWNYLNERLLKYNDSEKEQQQYLVRLIKRLLA